LQEQGSGTQNLADIHYSLSPNIQTFVYWYHNTSIIDLYLSIH